MMMRVIVKVLRRRKAEVPRMLMLKMRLVMSARRRKQRGGYSDGGKQMNMLRMSEKRRNSRLFDFDDETDEREVWSVLCGVSGVDG